jgi:hypothetical protein
MIQYYEVNQNQMFSIYIYYYRLFINIIDLLSFQKKKYIFGLDLHIIQTEIQSSDAKNITNFTIQALKINLIYITLH